MWKVNDLTNFLDIYPGKNPFISHVISLIYALSILTYFIITIIILSKDTDIHIWVYVLMGMICFVPIIILKTKVIFILILKIPLIIWGMVELSNYIELKGRPIWDIGLITVIIEIIVCLYVSIKYIFQEEPMLPIHRKTLSIDL